MNAKRHCRYRVSTTPWSQKTADAAFRPGRNCDFRTPAASLHIRQKDYTPPLAQNQSFSEVLSHFYNRAACQILIQFGWCEKWDSTGKGLIALPKPRSDSGKKNLISENLIELRKQHGLSQRDLARELQIRGCDMDKNVITRIETQKRYVTDIELQKLCEVFGVTFEELTRQS